MRTLDEIARELGELADTGVSRLARELLDALDEMYMQRLRHCSAQELVHVQSCLGQCEQLKKVFKGEPYSTGIA